MAHWRVQQWGTFATRWYIYDAKMQCPMLSGEKMATYLMGKHKPIFDQRKGASDNVIVVNTRHIAVKDNSLYWRRFLYTMPTRFGKYRVEETMEEIHRRDPTRLFYLETRAAMPNCLARLYWLEKMHMYPDGVETVPESLMENVSGVIRQVMPVPRRLDQYSPEEIRQFPKLFDWPEDYAVEPPKSS